MTEQSRTEQARAERLRAAQVVAEDPFWSVVRRRHPDLDIVLLPPDDGGRQETPAGAAVEEPAQVAAAEDASTRRSWARLFGDLGPLHTTWQTRWAAGGAPDRVRREATLAVDGVDAEVAVERLRAAAGSLEADGWHVLVPPDGLPRVMAGRDAALGRAELQLVLAPEAARLVMRARGADHVVGEAVARDLLLDAEVVS